MIFIGRVWCTLWVGSDAKSNTNLAYSTGRRGPDLIRRAFRARLSVATPPGLGHCRAVPGRGLLYSDSRKQRGGDTGSRLRCGRSCAGGKRNHELEGTSSPSGKGRESRYRCRNNRKYQLASPQPFPARTRQQAYGSPRWRGRRCRRNHRSQLAGRLQLAAGSQAFPLPPLCNPPAPSLRSRMTHHPPVVLERRGPAPRPQGSLSLGQFGDSDPRHLIRSRSFRTSLD